MKIVCMIPARLDSKRFPKKIFSKLGEKTLLGNVIDAAKETGIFDEVVVAVCSKEVAEVAHEHGAKAVLTSPSLENGTLRILSAIEQEGIEGDIFVNWQADEPFISKKMIHDLLDARGPADVWTLKKKVNREAAMESSIVKVVCDQMGKALYFSRSLIPFERGERMPFYKHIGLYAYTKEALKKISKFQKTPLEAAEKLEQLRWLEHGLSIEVGETTEEVVGIDTLADLQKANNFIKNS
ncbi:3-deoxy-manno-octulosonate cytidylyltransferase [bacterium]|nr:3-deoxy-manno-octulosonate cytidylyltransferase [bacterium]